MTTPRSFGLFQLLLVVLALINLLNVQVSTAKVVPIKDTMKQFKHWTCKQPQPRVVHIADLDQYVPNLIYTPSALVIHRCDKSTGCCLKPGAVCKSVESEEENVQFTVRIKAIQSKKLGKKQPSRALIDLKNHTRCECVDQADSRATRSIKLF